MRHTKTKLERVLRAAERREERDAKRAVRRQAKAERRSRRPQQVTTAWRKDGLPRRFDPEAFDLGAVDAELATVFGASVR
jgi:hypothetical protein